MKVPNEYRVREGMLGSDDSYENNGCFEIPFESRIIDVIVSDGEGWEHVSVSLQKRCPNWKEMCFIKKLFWGDEIAVVQFHPQKSDYVNIHNFCLHLWKKIGSEFELPEKYLV